MHALQHYGTELYARFRYDMLNFFTLKSFNDFNAKTPDEKCDIIIKTIAVAFCVFFASYALFGWFSLFLSAISPPIILISLIWSFSYFATTQSDALGSEIIARAVASVVAARVEERGQGQQALEGNDNRERRPERAVRVRSSSAPSSPPPPPPQHTKPTRSYASSIARLVI